MPRLHVLHTLMPRLHTGLKVLHTLLPGLPTLLIASATSPGVTAVTIIITVTIITTVAAAAAVTAVITAVPATAAAPYTRHAVRRHSCPARRPLQLLCCKRL